MLMLAFPTLAPPEACQPGDSYDLGKILVKLMRDENELIKLKNGAIKSSWRYYIDDHVKKLEKIYESIY